ncbi:BMP family ABC transporter substrate-binding protein [Rhodococcus sp. IEGM 1379]|uniref:BMP family ABC transporter substrate-binding protein n=1 Tax=Rhodococcus sp. IEGM 1379 TaxID=3047086 RepID=UPI0024B69A72|nr:BMP family ABC transporter substrate-binding protein [Rhodococcus sp. IEGM 1379]MDI9918140.1 BMP family ABC transporter substrate-binding protein [Rhodococcus sp. IEGM 1379]
MSRSRFIHTAAIACVTLAALTACSDRASNDAASADASSGSTTTGSQPDVNGDGKVVIGVISPGDLNDNGYYEAFVSSAQEFVDDNGWTLIKVGSVNPANALEQARNLCRQNVDLVAIAAQELKDALPAAEEPVCSNTNWYTPSGAGIKPTSRVTVSKDYVNEAMLAAGYANGIVMRDNKETKAGYITGPELDFSVMAAKAFGVGIRQLVPEATLTTTYTGDFNDSAKAREAAQAQISQGVQALYPYLGGATDSVAQLGTANGVFLSTPGTDRCAESDINWGVSVIFDPGAYFAAALAEFKDANLQMGTVREWHLGKDTVPTVKLCKGTDQQNAELTSFITKVGTGEIVPDDVIAASGA